MRAAQYTSYGALENVQIVDMPKPSIGLGQILVEVKAAGVNPIDWKCVMGFGDFFDEPSTKADPIYLIFQDIEGSGFKALVKGTKQTHVLGQSGVIGMRP